MPVTREARYLSGNEIGKTIVGPWQDTPVEILEIEHTKKLAWVMYLGPDGKRWNTSYAPTDIVTIIGKPS